MRQVKTGTLLVGGGVVCKVDYERRANVAPNHTMTHVLNFALRKVRDGDQPDFWWQQDGERATGTRFGATGSRFCAGMLSCCMTMKLTLHERSRCVEATVSTRKS